MLIFVKPKEGVTLRRPDTGRTLAVDGEKVPKNSFWRRRIAEGDVELIEQAEGEEKFSSAEPEGGEIEPPKAHKKYKRHSEGGEE